MLPGEHADHVNGKRVRTKEFKLHFLCLFANFLAQIQMHVLYRQVIYARKSVYLMNSRAILSVQMTVTQTQQSFVCISKNTHTYFYTHKTGDEGDRSSEPCLQQNAI